MKHSSFLLAGLLASLESCLYHVVTAAPDVNECKEYSKLDSANRSITNYDADDEKCDDGLEHGWYRFVGEAGRMMPTKCVAKFHCGAYGPGWLDGDLPMPQDGRVMRRVCFHLEGECCKETINIQVRNCGDFVVYNLAPPPRCLLKYCGDEMKELVPPECKTYGVLNGTNRAQGFYNPFVSLSDTGLTPGWYRFMDEAGSQMADKCVELFHCGTHATGWLNGAHPLKVEGFVIREVCFHWHGDCCYFKQHILVRHCDGFFVYEFPGTTKNFLRYCGNNSAAHHHHKHHHGY